jgi:hypothetical protein
MAEDEIAKHTKKIYKTWFNKEVPVWHKISEILIEIVIIVFAVTISIWFHNQSEHSHQQSEVKEFLSGMKSDLTHDIAEMRDDEGSYLKQKTIFSYISNLKIKEAPNEDTLRHYSVWILNTTLFNPNDGRFQGFKSSGKIGTIENEELQNDIMDLYQENIPSLLASSNAYIEIKKKLFEFYIKNNKRLSDSSSNFTTLVKMDEFLNICQFLSNPGQVLERYENCILSMNKIISEIAKENG